MDVNIYDEPSILVRLVHSVPHLNVSMNRVNSSFDPKNIIYREVSTISHNPGLLTQDKTASLKYFPDLSALYSFIGTYYSLNALVVMNEHPAIHIF